jgi:hypothetical protein
MPYLSMYLWVIAVHSSRTFGITLHVSDASSQCQDIGATVPSLRRPCSGLA